MRPLAGPLGLISGFLDGHGALVVDGDQTDADLDLGIQMVWSVD